jgi:hypothetical protein
MARQGKIYWSLGNAILFRITKNKLVQSQVDPEASKRVWNCKFEKKIFI